MSPIGTYLVETLITLACVVGLAALVLVGGRRLGFGKSSGPLELLGKLPLDPRRAVYLVRVGKLVYIVAASEGGLVRLGELDVDHLPVSETGRTPTRVGTTFRSVLERIGRAGIQGHSTTRSEHSTMSPREEQPRSDGSAGRLEE
jgi:flagellar biogenesis protein FliO